MYSVSLMLTIDLLFFSRLRTFELHLKFDVSLQLPVLLNSSSTRPRYHQNGAEN